MTARGVPGWTRVLNQGACVLCRDLAGPVLPGDAPMYHHKGCGCAQRPVLNERSTRMTERDHRARGRRDHRLATRGHRHRGDPTEEDPETFPREYVVQLREEAAKHRTRAQDRDALAQRLHTALVAATGRLADPTDLAFDDAHLADDDALSAAIDDLLARKPHLASRRVVGDIGQGATGSDSTVDLAGMLRRNAS